MIDWIMFSGYYFPPFTRVFIAGFAAWALLRQVYVPILYKSNVYQPYLIDICGLITVTSLVYYIFTGL